MSIYSAELLIETGGSFLARPYTVGTCEEELDDLRCGRLDRDRGIQILNCMTIAAECLRAADPMGTC